MRNVRELIQRFGQHVIQQEESLQMFTMPLQMLWIMSMKASLNLKAAKASQPPQISSLRQ